MDRSPRRDVPAEPGLPCRCDILFEACGCDSPVAASHVRATPETVKVPVAGGLVAEGSAYGYAVAVRGELDGQLPDQPGSAYIRVRRPQYATSIGQAAVFEGKLATNP